MMPQSLTDFRAGQWLVLAHPPTHSGLLAMGLTQGLRLRYLGKQLGSGPMLLQWSGRTLALDQRLAHGLRFYLADGEQGVRCEC